MADFLEVCNLKVCYAGGVAVEDVSFETAEGSVAAIVGRNGGGKSSLVRAIFGLRPITSGLVSFRGKDITRLPPFSRVGLGMALVPEGRGTLPEMSVLENLEMGAYTIRDKRAIDEAMEEAFHYFPILAERRKQRAGSLSGGEQQMLAVGRALMSRPVFLAMDEPSHGLAPILIQKLGEIVSRIYRDGKSILIVEQNAQLAFSVSEEIMVIDSGRIVLRGKKEAIIQDELLREAFLGG